MEKKTPKSHHHYYYYPHHHQQQRKWTGWWWWVRIHRLILQTPISMYSQRGIMGAVMDMVPAVAKPKDGRKKHHSYSNIIIIIIIIILIIIINNNDNHNKNVITAKKNMKNRDPWLQTKVLLLVANWGFIPQPGRGTFRRGKARGNPDPTRNPFPSQLFQVNLWCLLGTPDNSATASVDFQGSILNFGSPLIWKDKTKKSA